MSENTKGVAPTPPAAAPPTAAAAAAAAAGQGGGAAPCMSGWLKKQGAQWKSWRRRYFVLDGTHLRYYKRQQDHEARGSINLENSGHIHGVQHRKATFAFQIQTPSRTFLISAASADERDRWVEALNAALAELHHGALQSAVGVKDFEVVRLQHKFGDTEKVMRVRRTGDPQSLYTMRVVQRTDKATSDFVEQKASELFMMQKLHHPFVQNLHYHFTTDAQYFFLLDAVEGTPLTELLKAHTTTTTTTTTTASTESGGCGGLAPELVRFIGAEVCLALEHVHNAGFAWPQTNPAQVLVARDGHVCLCTDNDRLLCSCRADYRAPELIGTPGAPYTPSSDWWCFGCLLYELLTGEAPFRGDDDDALQRSIAEQTAAIAARAEAAAVATASASNGTAEALDLIAKLLEPSAEQRLAKATLIKRHEFFERIDLEKLYKKQIEPPTAAVAVPAQGAAATPSTTPASDGESAFDDFTFVAHQ